MYRRLGVDFWIPSRDLSVVDETGYTFLGPQTLPLALRDLGPCHNLLIDHSPVLLGLSDAETSFLRIGHNPLRTSRPSEVTAGYSKFGSVRLMSSCCLLLSFQVRKLLFSKFFNPYILSLDSQRFA